MDKSLLLYGEVPVVHSNPVTRKNIFARFLEGESMQDMLVRGFDEGTLERGDVLAEVLDPSLAPQPGPESVVGAPSHGDAPPTEWATRSLHTRACASLAASRMASNTASTGCFFHSNTPAERVISA